MKNRYLPFGYKIADGKIVADSEQVEAVRRIFDAYTAGQTFQQIADALSAQGIPYRSDASRWNKNMVSRILANADYCGTAEYPQIITAGQFEAAEQIRKSKTVTYSATLKPFRKDMHCGCCGARLYWHPKSNQWFCRECGMWSKPTQAEETFNSIVEKLRWLQQNPELIHPPAGKANVQSMEIVLLDREIEQALLKSCTGRNWNMNSALQEMPTRQLCKYKKSVLSMRQQRNFRKPFIKKSSAR